MKLAAIFVTVLVATTPALAVDTTDILGLWNTEKGDVRVRFYRCGEKICGRVVWLKEPHFLDPKDGPVGTAKVDRKNPNPALRDRPILGLQVMKDIMPTGLKKWGSGACYDPESGKTYKCKMRLVSANRLEIRGFVGVSLFGRDYVLVR